jgi:hypothetical protein
MRWRLHAAVVSTVLVGLLTGCVSFNLVSPQDKAAVRNGSGVPVDAKASPHFDKFSITVDTQPTAAVPCQTDSACAGPVTVPAGTHAMAFSADAPCWYCSPREYTWSETRSVCVGHDPAILAASAVVAAVKTSGKVWTNVSDNAATVATAGASNDAKWRTYNLSGGLQAIGLIQSVANDCLCMQSSGDPAHPGVQLAWCDFTKATPSQIWESWPAGNGNASAHRYKNSGSQNCLTEEASGSLEDRNCDLSIGATPNDAQIWTLTNGTGVVVQPF